MHAHRLDFGLDPLGVLQQQIALLPRLGVPKLAVGLVGAHLLNPDTHRAQARQNLQRVEILLAITAVAAARVAGDRTDQPDLLVIAQRRPAQPAAPGNILDGESRHEATLTYLKRLKSRALMNFFQRQPVGSVTLGTDNRAANTDPTCSSPIAGPRRLLSLGER